MDPRVRFFDALGYNLSHGRVTPKDDLIQQIRQYRLMDDQKSLRKFLGKLAFVATVYPHIQQYRNTLFAGLNAKRYKVTPTMRHAVEAIKKAMLLPAPLTSIQPGPITISTDANKESFAAAITQNKKVIAQIARKYPRPAYQHYSSTHREAFGLLSALEQYSDLVRNHPTTLQTDHHDLIDMLRDPSKPQLHPVLTRLITRIAEFDFQLQWVPRENKDIQYVDALSLQIETQTTHDPRNKGKNVVIRHWTVPTDDPSE
jgi:hypothetical protein